MQAMEKLKNSAGKGGGIVSLHQYLPKDSKEITPLAAKTFWNRNIGAIRSCFPTAKEREANRAELKMLTRSLMEQPLGNPMLACFDKWNGEFPNCQFGLLLETVMADFDREQCSMIDPESLKTTKQLPGESIAKFNARFNDVLAVAFPDYDRRKTDRISEGEAPLTKDELNLRNQLFNIYYANLLEPIQARIPDYNPQDKCLRVAMEKAFSIEITLKGLIQAKKDNEEAMARKGGMGVLGVYNVTASNNNNNNHSHNNNNHNNYNNYNDNNNNNGNNYQNHRNNNNNPRYPNYNKNQNNAECHNCGMRGHFIKDCRKAKITCHKCKRIGHMEKYCRSNIPQNRNGQQRRGFVKNNAYAITLVAIIACFMNLITIMEAQEVIQQPYFVTDIFKVTNKRAGCDKHKFVPMIGLGNKFITPRGNENIRFETTVDTIGGCDCEDTEQGFRNGHTGDCFIPMETYPSKEGSRIIWELPFLAMELKKGEEYKTSLAWATYAEYVTEQTKTYKLQGNIRTEPIRRFKNYEQGDAAEVAAKERQIIQDLRIKYEKRMKDLYNKREISTFEKIIDPQFVEPEIEEITTTRKPQATETPRTTVFMKIWSPKIISQSPTVNLQNYGQGIKESISSESSDTEDMLDKTLVPKMKELSFRELTPINTPDLTFRTPKQFEDYSDKSSIKSDNTEMSYGKHPRFNGILRKEMKDQKGTDTTGIEDTEVESLKYGEWPEYNKLRTKGSLADLSVNSRKTVDTEENTEALKKNLQNIMSMVQNIENHGINEIKSEMEKAVNNTNGLSAVGVLGAVFSVLLGLYFRKSIAQAVVTGVFSKIGKIPQLHTSITTTKTINNTKYIPVDVEPRAKINRLSLVEDADEDMKMKDKRRKGGVFALAVSKEENEDGYPLVLLEIAYKFMEVFIDDGSDISLMSEERWIQLGSPKLTIECLKIKNTNDAVTSMGRVNLWVGIPKKQRIEEEFHVVKGLNLPVLIGRTYLKNFGSFGHDYVQNTIRLGRSTLKIRYANKTKKLILRTAIAQTIAPGETQDFY
uniref:CCHC-type domain-containing protein n=1 Tax=Parastrongyloides trichosuri TaxID=131310 RepID=A0A0N4ZD94_PARTI